MKSILDAQAEWRLLRNVHPFLSQALFSTSLAELDLGPLKPNAKLDIQNSMTVARIDIKTLPLILQQVQLEHLLRDDEFDRFISALHSLLALFERFVPDSSAKSSADSGVSCSSGELDNEVRGERLHYDYSTDEDLPDTLPQADRAATPALHHAD
jgi:hypothetical protein